MSKTTTSNSINVFNNLERISPYTIEEFNKLLEDNKPYTKETYKVIFPNTIETLTNTTLDYNINLKILVCSKCKIYLDNNTKKVIKNLLVSIFRYYYL